MNIATLEIKPTAPYVKLYHYKENHQNFPQISLPQKTEKTKETPKSLVSKKLFSTSQREKKTLILMFILFSESVMTLLELLIELIFFIVHFDIYCR